MPDNNNDILEQIRYERDFIHDLATPLMIAMGMSDYVLNSLEANTEDFERLTKAKNSLNKINEIIKARRKVLVDQSNQLKETK